jgi:hypothetical protein
MMEYQYQAAMPDENHHSSERSLWCAVLARAVSDALGVEALGDRTVIRQARHWFSSNGRDFQQVCDAAGLDPKFVREHVLRLIQDRSDVNLFGVLVLRGRRHEAIGVQ